jgi:competence ComEA-like helix-hairpin-helix protein
MHLKNMINDSRIRRTTDELSRVQSMALLVASGLAVGFCLWFGLPGVAADGVAGAPELEHRINPNDATPASLMRLPGVGLSRAQAIVTYRQQFRQSGKGDLAFQDCNDLDKVKGIGPATVRDMCEWLKFE